MLHYSQKNASVIILVEWHALHEGHAGIDPMRKMDL